MAAHQGDGEPPPVGRVGPAGVVVGVVDAVAVPVDEGVCLDVVGLPVGVVCAGVVVGGAVVRCAVVLGTVAVGAGCTPPFGLPVVDAPVTADTGRTAM